MKIGKIVVGVDFSGESAIAMEHAVHVAQLTGAEIVSVHARPLPGNREAIVPLATTASRSLDQELLKLRCERYSHRGTVVSHVFIDATPDAGLSAVASAMDADLIVVGSHDRKGTRRLLAGSVAERVVKLAGVSVMVARFRGPVITGYRRILVPTDFSASAEQALELAMGLISPGGVIELFHAWEIPDAGSYSDASPVMDVAAAPVRAAWRDEVRARGMAMLERHRTPPHVDIVFSDDEDAVPKRAIRKRLDSFLYDLVVMGSHGRRGFQRFLLGSVAEATARRSSCSVLVVHTQDQEARAESCPEVRYHDFPPLI